MAASSRRSSGGAAVSPAAFASYSSSLASRPSFFGRSSAPFAATPSAATVRFSLDNRRPSSPGRSLAADSPAVKRPIAATPAARRRTCMCSPTNHPGSFRCSRHKGVKPQTAASGSSPSPSIRLNARRSAMTNSLVRIGAVEGELGKRALAALIRPSSHGQRRRSAFRPRPSRLSVVSTAADP